MRPFSICVCCFLVAGSSVAGDVFRESPSNPAKEYAKFHIGVTGISASIKKGLVVTVEETAPGTPAAGKFKKGDVLTAINGKLIADAEPWVALGQAIGAAEAADGRMVFALTRDGKDEQIIIQIPVLGAYSKTWPLACEKSDAIIRQTAERIMLKRAKLGKGLTDSLAGLFLLSTGDDAYLPTVQAMVMRHAPAKSGNHTWNNGYAGILLGEYYLRTGDTAALPRLKAICDDSARRSIPGAGVTGVKAAVAAMCAAA
jgi:hypothetical protein